MTATGDIIVKLVFLGMPGAGKGTQAAIMADELELKHASTGDIFREAVREESRLGRKVKEYLDGGRLVPDELTSRVVGEVVLSRFDSYVLDGYPRTLQQARDLTRMLDEQDQSLDAVIHFDLGEREAVERLTGRLVCRECGKNYHRKFMPPQREGVCDQCGGELASRSDSTLETVTRRLDEYKKKTAPLVPYYQERGLLRAVDASPPPEQVSEETRQILTSL